MPEFHRRTLLQMLGAASLAPALPAMPARAAASSAVTPAKLLWASLYANAGTPENFRGLTQSMGISAQATQGVQARLAGTRLLAAHGAVRVKSAVRPVPAAAVHTPAVTKAPKIPKAHLRKALEQTLEARPQKDVPPQPDAAAGD